MSKVTFEDAEDLRDLLKEVIEEDKDTLFSHLSSKLFVLRRRKGEKEVEWYARIKLVPKEYKDMFDSDAEYIIEFDESNFDPMSDLQKKGIVFHELNHTFLTDKGTYKLLKHPIMEFPVVIERYGSILPMGRRVIESVEKYNQSIETTRHRHPEVDG